jgi:hypothetical protein
MRVVERDWNLNAHDTSGYIWRANVQGLTGLENRVLKAQHIRSRLRIRQRPSTTIICKTLSDELRYVEGSSLTTQAT